MIRVGVMGGTFDPLHLGHLYCAENARSCCDLTQVLFVPANRSPFKPESKQASATDRWTMVELAIAGNPAFAASRVELDRGGPSYTVDTLRSLAADYAAAGRAVELCLIIGADSLLNLGSWREPAEILRLASIAVVPRPGTADALVKAAAAQLTAIHGARVTVCDGPALDISSTDLRQRIAAGRSIRYLVPDAVATYIADRGLYA